jgi:ankyrin repeat protein
MLGAGNQKGRRAMFAVFSVGLTIVLTSLAPPSAQAVMPPEVYARASRESHIKAIATIVDVKITHVGMRATTKDVTFQLDYWLTEDAPETFTGSCESVDTPQQKTHIMAGGTIYFYPHVGSRVFVTVSDDGGPITSMTPMTQELEQIIRKEPERIQYGIARVGIMSRDGKSSPSIRRFPPAKKPAMPEPVLRGKEPLPEDQRSPMALLDELGREAQPPKRSRDELQGRLLLALGNDDVAEAGRLIEQGANVNTAISSTGQTPVMAAESARMAQLLIDQGADPRAVDTKGGTALHYAVSRKNAPELIRLFASRGVDPNRRGWENAPAIFVAADYFNETRAFEPEFIMPDEAGLDKGVNAPPGPSPQSVLQALIDVGADVNARDAYGNTLLMNAVVQDNADMVKLLLALGADKSLKKDNGATAKDTAYEMGHRYIYQLLD